MKKYCYLLLCASMLARFGGGIFAQTAAPAIVWQQTIGGTNMDVLTAMCIGNDKSIVLCGYSNSGKSGNQSNASFGSYDYWVVKMNANGTILWNKCYGGKDDDFAAAIISTSDGGYLLGGSSVSNKSGNKSVDSYGNSFDYWVLKLDANGNILWDRTMGGLSTEYLTGLAELPGKIYVIGGYAYSKNNGFKTLANLGPENNSDYWPVLLNADGSPRSQYVFGAVDLDVMTCVSASGVSSYYAAGYSYSNKLTGGKSQNSNGNNDFWIVRSNLNGTYEYQGQFGGKLSDYLTCMQALPDSSFVVGGYSNSDPGNSKSGAFYGLTDYWLLKLKRNGTKQWDKTFGSKGADYMTAVQQTKDKGFLLGGYSNSNMGNSKTANSRGGYDFWIIKTDSLGNKQWDKTIGGNKDDTLIAVYEIAANEYIIAGTSASPKSGDKTANTIGTNTTDYWVMKLSSSQPLITKSATNSYLNRHAANGSAANTCKLRVISNAVKERLAIRYTTAFGSNQVALYDAGGK